MDNPGLRLQKPIAIAIAMKNLYFFTASYGRGSVDLFTEKNRGPWDGPDFLAFEDYCL
jgi:hypothetical protein